MPYSKKYVRPRRARKPRRRFNKRRMYKRASRVPRGVSVYSNFKRVTHQRLCGTLSLTGTSGAMGTFSLSANGPFNVDGAGAQPMFWDQQVLFWDHYVVLGAKITLRYVPTSANLTAFIAGIFLNDDNSFPGSNYRAMSESGRSRYKLFTVNTSGTSGTNQTLTQKFSAKKFFNVTNVKDRIYDIGAATSSLPVDPAQFTIYIQDVNNTTTVQATFLYTIDYIIQWSEPKDISNS